MTHGNGDTFLTKVEKLLGIFALIAGILVTYTAFVWYLVNVRFNTVEKSFETVETALTAIAQSGKDNVTQHNEIKTQIALTDQRLKDHMKIRDEKEN